jgi:hypothetical protein
MDRSHLPDSCPQSRRPSQWAHTGVSDRSQTAWDWANWQAGWVSLSPSSLACLLWLMLNYWVQLVTFVEVERAQSLHFVIETLVTADQELREANNCDYLTSESRKDLHQSGHWVHNLIDHLALSDADQDVTKRLIGLSQLLRTLGRWHCLKRVWFDVIIFILVITWKIRSKPI